MVRIPASRTAVPALPAWWVPRPTLWRHLAAARRLAPDATHADDRELLPSVLVALYQDIGIPNGLAAVGFSESDLDALVEGTMKQQRLLTTAPRPVEAADAREVLAQAMRLW